MSVFVKLLLILLGSVSISGVIILYVVMDTKMNKLYKDDMKDKMLHPKFLWIMFSAVTVIVFIFGYFIFV